MGREAFGFLWREILQRKGGKRGERSNPADEATVGWTLRVLLETLAAYEFFSTLAFFNYISRNKSG
jgi:hypothetical protein